MSRILICEDDSTISRGLKDLLEMDGHRVETRSSVKRSIDVLNEDQARPKLQDRFAVVVVDLDFDDTAGSYDGMKILEVAKKDPLLESIVYTGKGSEELAAKAVTLGVYSYIMKISKTPLTQDHLYQTITQALGLHNQCLRLIEEIEHIADTHSNIPKIRSLSAQLVNYVRNVRGRGR
jgi:DNA-binding NtrC family response regulator